MEAPYNYLQSHYMENPLKMDPYEAVMKLSDEPPGSWLIRSSSNAACVTITVKTESKIEHTRCQGLDQLIVKVAQFNLQQRFCINEKMNREATFSAMAATLNTALNSKLNKPGLIAVINGIVGSLNGILHDSQTIQDIFTFCRDNIQDCALFNVNLRKVLQIAKEVFPAGNSNAVTLSEFAEAFEMLERSYFKYGFKLSEALMPEAFLLAGVEEGCTLALDCKDIFPQVLTQVPTLMLSELSLDTEAASHVCKAVVTVRSFFEGEKIAEYETLMAKAISHQRLPFGLFPFLELKEKSKIISNPNFTYFTIGVGRFENNIADQHLIGQCTNLTGLTSFNTSFTLCLQSSCFETIQSLEFNPREILGKIFLHDVQKFTNLKKIKVMCWGLNDMFKLKSKSLQEFIIGVMKGSDRLMEAEVHEINIEKVKENFPSLNAIKFNIKLAINCWKEREFENNGIKLICGDQ